MKPFFSGPVVRPCNLLPTSGDFALSQLTPKTIQYLPEPPWIKRSNHGVIFTNEGQLVEDIEFCSESNYNSRNETSEEEINTELIKTTI